MGKWCGSSALWSALSRWKIDEINRKWSNGKHWILFARISNNNNNIVLLSFPLVRLRPVADLSRDGHAFIHSYSYQFWLPAKETGRYIQLWSYVYAINFMIGLATKWVRTPIDAPHNRWMGELILPEKWRILRMELHRCCCSSIIPRRKFLLVFFLLLVGQKLCRQEWIEMFYAWSDRADAALASGTSARVVVVVDGGGECLLWLGWISWPDICV